jgi:cytoplasmic iron level regulating protein YaaA (DUF328/UPF0246 family)
MANKPAKPLLLPRAIELANYCRSLSPRQIAKVMAISPALASKTHQLIASWTPVVSQQSPAIDTFLGDIYSGLQVDSWSDADRDYANATLRILSGLYGILRPNDGIYPYRLEMAYKLPNKKYTNLYTFWGESIANTLPKAGSIINLSAVEYSKTILPYVEPSRVTTPNFLTINPKTNEPIFVVVHAKIARGAFASWLIRKRITKSSDLSKFGEIGYTYHKALSTPRQPVFVCKEFGGKGLSVRLK